MFLENKSIMYEFVGYVGSMNFYQIRGKLPPEIDRPVKRCRGIAKFDGAYSPAVTFYEMRLATL